MILWGVGNHGGGPSRKDIEDIAKLKEEIKDRAEITHSTPDAYFEATKNKKVPVKRHSLVPCNTGCLTSMALIKQYYRELENTLFLVEKMATSALENELIKYPYERLKEAVLDLIFVQFHDILPGSAIKEVERAGLRKAEHGLQILNEIRAKCFFALSAGLKAKPDTYPVLVYNPHPYVCDTTVECEFQLADQNWNDTFTLMDVYDRDGNKLESQIEKESCNLNLDWRKRVVFNAKLKPMSMNAFDCVPNVVNSIRKFDKIDGDYIFTNGKIKAVIEKKSGLLTQLSLDGKEIISKPIKFTVQDDTEDPWGMQAFQYKELGQKVGEFTLVSDEEAREIAHIKTPIDAVHLIEDGPVRSSVECIFKFNKSFLTVRYVLDKKNSAFDIFLNVIWCEKDRNFKVEVTPSYKYEILGETAFGYQTLTEGGLENDIQKWCHIKGESSISVVNYGNYAVSSKDGSVRFTMLRSPAYTGHPINDREILHQDRYTSRIDLGERNFRLSVFLGKDQNQLSVESQLENEKPFALSFFPLGKGERVKPLLVVDNKVIILSALYKDEKGNVVFRLYNSTDKEQSGRVVLEKYSIDKIIEFGRFEIKTFIVEDGKLYQTDLKQKGRETI
jgi:alpha-mannosidase